MRYSIEPRDRIYVTGYGFLSLAKNKGKSLSNKYDQNFLIALKNLQQMEKKTASKRAIQKTAETTGNLIGNKTSVSKTSVKALQNNETEEDAERATPKKRYISPEERKQIIAELRLVPKKDVYF